MIDLQKSDKVFHEAKNGFTRDEADYVVVGTGPSGATAARVLSEAGHDVIMIEEGRLVQAEEFNGRGYQIQKNCYRDMGTLAAMGKNVIPIIQGRCVGGGSVINAAIIWRMPQDVFGRWAEEHQIEAALTWKELEESFDIIERELYVAETPANVLGRNNLLLRQGADKLGIESRIIPRNVRDCTGLAQCLTGCPIRAKKSTDLNYVPFAVERGARLYAGCKAGHIDMIGGRAARIHGEFRDPVTGERKGRLVAHARKGIVLCCSPIQTPMLLMSSGIGLESGHLGRHLTGHPGAGVECVYKDEVRIWEGASQGWDSEHFRKSDKVKFEALSIPPDLLAARVPGAGSDFMKAMREYDRIGNVGCALVTPTEGTVRDLFGSPFVTYSLDGEDMRRLRKGMRLCAEIMAAAGAEAIFPGIYGLPPRIKPDQLKLFDEAPLDPRSYTMVMTHLFGTCRMGLDPRKSVTGVDFQVHGAKGLYILDSSIFPTNLGVNPQHTIMGIAMAGAKRISSQ